MAKEGGHAPLPWRVFEGQSRGRLWKDGKTVSRKLEGNWGDVGIALCDFNTDKGARANAAFIVRACNAHDAHEELVAAVKRLSQVSDGIYVRMSGGEHDAMKAAWDRVDAALAKATASPAPATT